MNNDTTPEHWHRTSEELRSRYPDLTEEDLIYEEGNEEELIQNLQQKLGKPRSEVKQIIKNSRPK
jgi:uncharacterized protein YjbJ (UPF0337 family)